MEIETRWRADVITSVPGVKRTLERSAIPDGNRQADVESQSQSRQVPTRAEECNQEMERQRPAPCRRGNCKHPARREPPAARTPHVPCRLHPPARRRRAPAELICLEFVSFDTLNARVSSVSIAHCTVHCTRGRARCSRCTLPMTLLSSPSSSIVAIFQIWKIRFSGNLYRQFTENATPPKKNAV